ncbi:hypothetical protein [Brachybacterium sp. GPGPB12]|uniref:hypothetical protein n=1 Tax=Brachybacterium sp. GPGPB12 TaxID=3023517 RepID=UPI0031342BF2
MIADLEGLDAESEVGASYRELIEEIASDRGARVIDATLAPEQATDPESEDVHERPAPEATGDGEDDFDFDFTPPPIVRGGL